MLVAILLSADFFQIRDLSISSRAYATELTALLILVDLVAPDHHQHAENSIGKLKDLRMTKTTEKIIIIQVVSPGLPLGGRTPYITSKNRLRTPKLHIKDVPRTSENSLVRPKMDIETSCLQKKPAHIYQNM